MLRLLLGFCSARLLACPQQLRQSGCLPESPVMIKAGIKAPAM